MSWPAEQASPAALHSEVVTALEANVPQDVWRQIYHRTSGHKTPKRHLEAKNPQDVRRQIYHRTSGDKYTTGRLLPEAKVMPAMSLPSFHCAISDGGAVACSAIWRLGAAMLLLVRM